MFKIFLSLIIAFSFGSIRADALSLSASSAILIDSVTGDAVFEKNADKRMPMASTTKIMTAICAIENINTNIPVTVDSRAVGVEGSSIYLAHGEVITIKELLYGMMLNSGNDAATALAIAVSGSVEEFCSLMNRTANRIGAVSTNFVNPSGLYDDNHYTTARDLALITAYAMKNPLFRAVVGTKEMTVSNSTADGKRYLKNHNKLLWQYDGCTGVKTGYTKKCGRCLVSSAQRDGAELIAVTLNAPDDWRDHTALFDYGFSNVKNRIISSAGEYAMTVNVEDVSVPLCFEESLEACVEPEKLCIEYDIADASALPVNQGEKMGVAHLVYNSKIIDSSALVCQENITTVPEEKSFVRIFSENIKKFVSCFQDF